MLQNRWVASWGVLLVVGIFGFCGDLVGEDEGLVSEREGYETHGVGFLREYCFGCHGNEKDKGGYNFETLSLELEKPEVGDLWEDIFAQVQFKEMPPSKSEAQPPAAERTGFLKWLDGMLTAHDRGFGLEEKMVLPEYANYLDHGTLFDGSAREKAFTPARLWRQRPAIYDSLWSDHYGRSPWLSVKIGSAARMEQKSVVTRGPHQGKTLTTRYFRDSRYANPFFEFVHHAAGFTDYATIRADQASLESLLTNSEKMAEVLTEGLLVSIVTEVKNKDSRHGNNHGGFVGGVETRSAVRRGRVPAVFKKIVDSDGEIGREAFDEALEIAFALLLRRAPDDGEKAHYWEHVFQRNASLGNKMALQAVLIYLTLSPEFVYRMEIGMGEPDAEGRRMLSPRELVYAIHYAFDSTPAYGVDDFETVDVFTGDSEPAIRKVMTGGNPSYRKDGWLVAQMEAGELKTREDVERAVRKILDERQSNLSPNHNSPLRSVRRPRVLQFFREFFGYHKASTVFKDVEEFKTREGFQQFHGHSAFRMMYDTDALVLGILEEDQNVLEELLTTNRVHASYWSGKNDEAPVKRAGGREKYAVAHDLQSYNLDPFENEYTAGRGRGKQALLAPEAERCGVLTQPSWLVAHSGNFDNDPVRRGKWIRERLLAGSVLDVPINVDAQVPDDEEKTLRERFSVVREEECWRCHTKMNPLGMVFEAYNHVGRYRELEKGRPVDTSGAISHTGVAGLDGEVGGVREMMERIAGSALARQSFIRHVFRYWMGRNELLSDSATLMEMDRVYVDSGGSFKELLVSLLTSDSFLYRK